MLRYDQLKHKDRAFLAATSLKPEEFQKLLPAFEDAYETLLSAREEISYPFSATLQSRILSQNG
jgi:hypothetical protein